MRLSTYKSILLRANAAIGGPSDGPGNEEEAVLRQWINRRLRFAHEYYWWPELMRVQERSFRTAWASGTTYGQSSLATPVEVYYGPAETYYQSLRSSNTGNAPATLTGTTWVENSAYWAECESSYSGNSWAASTVYAVGDIVLRNNDSSCDNEYYQCHTAHTSTSSFDTTKFTVLNEFRQSIDAEQTGETAIGDLREVWNTDPRVHADADMLVFRMWGDEFIVRGSDLATVWCDFRIRYTELTGNDWAAGVYAVGDLVYYDTTGDWYTCIQVTTNQAPTDTAYWTKLEIPYALAEYAAQGAAADYLLRNEKEFIQYGTDEDTALALLMREINKIETQQQQNRQLKVITR